MPENPSTASRVDVQTYVIALNSAVSRSEATLNNFLGLQWSLPIRDGGVVSHGMQQQSIKMFYQRYA